MQCVCGGHPWPAAQPQPRCSLTLLLSTTGREKKTGKSFWVKIRTGKIVGKTGSAWGGEVISNENRFVCWGKRQAKALITSSAGDGEWEHEASCLRLLLRPLLVRREIPAESRLVPFPPLPPTDRCHGHLSHLSLTPWCPFLNVFFSKVLPPEPAGPGRTSPHTDTA